MSEGYKIERINSDRLKDLLPLYKDAFGKSVSLKYFQQKFDTACFGAEYIGFIAYAPNGSSAAYYGLFPCKVMYDGRVLSCATSGDTMTHSAHRGKGLFVELAGRTYQLAKDNGIKFAYGFPNQNSLQGSIKLGWKYMGDQLKLFTVKVPTIPLEKWKKKLGINNKAHCVTKGFLNSLSENKLGWVLHDDSYFNYKTYSPKSIQMICGSRVWMKRDGILKIGDVEGINNFKMKEFLDELKSFARWRGIAEIQFMVSKGTWLDKELSSCLEGIDVFPIGHFHIDTDGLDLSKMKYGMGDIDTF